MKILSGILIIVSTLLSIKHGWDGLHYDTNPAQAKMAAELGMGKTTVMVASVINIIVAIALLFPKTFFAANLLHAFMLLTIMAFSLRAGNNKTALIEIPFLILPLFLIYLGHPLKK